MNTYEIEALVRAADQLRNYERGSKGDNVHEKILDLVAVELGRVESNNEVASLQVSNSNKQANLNLLSGKLLAVLDMIEGVPRNTFPEYLSEAAEELKTLAKSLIQEEPAAGAAG